MTNAECASDSEQIDTKAIVKNHRIVRTYDALVLTILTHWEQIGIAGKKEEVRNDREGCSWKPVTRPQIPNMRSVTRTDTQFSPPSVLNWRGGRKCEREKRTNKEAIARIFGGRKRRIYGRFCCVYPDLLMISLMCDRKSLVPPTTIWVKDTNRSKPRWGKDGSQAWRKKKILDLGPENGWREVFFRSLMNPADPFIMLKLIQFALSVVCEKPFFTREPKKRKVLNGPCSFLKR